MDNTVRIEGVDYAPCEIVQSGTFWGVKTPKKTYWVFPVCDNAGSEIKSVPPYLPCEIRSVTLETPDLTQHYPETVKELFDKRHSYFSTATLHKYTSQYPNESWLTEEQFQTARNQILGETLEDFVRDPLARQMVWDRHGTGELANQIGYLGHVYVTETLKDGTTRRISTAGSVATSLAFRLQEKRKIGWDQAQNILGTLKHVMIYESVPEQQFIYLSVMKTAAAFPRQTPRALELRVYAKIESHLTPKAQLKWPVGEEMLKAIKTDTTHTKETVAALHGKKMRQERKWQQKGGRATSKWIGHEKEAADLAQDMRQVKRSWIKTNGTKRGARKKAIESGRAWWKKKFKGTALENFLDKQKISDSNLGRLMKRDFRKNHGPKA